MYVCMYLLNLPHATDCMGARANRTSNKASQMYHLMISFGWQYEIIYFTVYGPGEVQPGRCDINVAWKVPHGIRSSFNHFDQSYNPQNRMGTFKTPATRSNS